MKTYCIHHNDLDGRAAAATVKHYDSCPDIIFYEVDYMPESIKKIVDLISVLKAEDTVYIVDYSFKENTKYLLDQIRNVIGSNLIWIDHHTSTQD